MKVAGTRPDGNENIWFSVERVRKVAASIAAKLKAIALPAAAGGIDANLARVNAKLDAVQLELDAVKLKTAGNRVIFSEPIGAYLADALGEIDATPTAFSKAIEEGRDIPPAAALQVEHLLKSGKIDLLVYSSATVGSPAQKILNTNQQQVPATQVGELLMQDPDSYEWSGDFFSYLSSSIADMAIMRDGK